MFLKNIEVSTSWNLMVKVELELQKSRRENFVQFFRSELIITLSHKTELEVAYAADLLHYKDPVYLKHKAFLEVVKKHWSSLTQDCVAFEVSMIIQLYTVGTV